VRRGQQTSSRHAEGGSGKKMQHWERLRGPTRRGPGTQTTADASGIGGATASLDLQEGGWSWLREAAGWRFVDWRETRVRVDERWFLKRSE